MDIRITQRIVAASAIAVSIACSDGIGPAAPVLSDQPSLAAGSGGGALVKSIVGLEPFFTAALNQSLALQISSLGQVVGQSNSATSNYLQAAIWEGSTYAFALGPDGAIDSRATAILPDGSVIVGHIGEVAVRWLKVNGVWTSFDLPGQTFGDECRADDIASDGTIVGTCIFASAPQHVVLWQNGIMKDLGEGVAIAVNRNQQIVVQTGGESVLWDLRTNPMTVTALGTLGGSGSTARDINDLGQVVGSSRNSADVLRPFLWTARKGMVDLGTLGAGLLGQANAINDNGQIVGSSRVQGLVTHATYWYKGKIQDLGVLPGYETSSATGLNSAGQIVGVSSATGANVRATLWTLAR